MKGRSPVAEGAVNCLSILPVQRIGQGVGCQWEVRELDECIDGTVHEETGW